MEIINKKTKEVFKIVCSTAVYIIIANVKTKELILLGDTGLTKDYELK